MSDLRGLGLPVVVPAVQVVDRRVRQLLVRGVVEAGDVDGVEVTTDVGVEFVRDPPSEGIGAADTAEPVVDRSGVDLVVCKRVGPLAQAKLTVGDERGQYRSLAQIEQLQRLVPTPGSSSTSKRTAPQ